jgi:hypothetical protein
METKKSLRKPNRKLELLIRLFFVLGTAAAAVSCTDFFTTSLAGWAQRNPASLIRDVNTGNVDEYIRNAENNPDLSLEVLRGIQAAVEEASGADKAELQAAALRAAANATGLGSSMLNTLSDTGKITAAADDANAAKELITNTILNMENLGDTGSVLMATLPDPAGDPAGFNAFLGAADANDLALAAAVLIAAEASMANGGSGSYIENFDRSGALTPKENLAVKLAEAAVEKYKESDSGGPLKSILEGLGWA